MKALLMLVMVLGFSAPLVAQDSTAAPPAAPPAAPSNVSVEAVLARSVVDRAPQDSGTAFPDSVGSVVDVAVRRAGEPMRFKLTIGERPET